MALLPFRGSEGEWAPSSLVLMWPASLGASWLCACLVLIFVSIVTHSSCIFVSSIRAPIVERGPP